MRQSNTSPGFRRRERQHTPRTRLRTCDVVPTVHYAVMTTTWPFTRAPHLATPYTQVFSLRSSLALPSSIYIKCLCVARRNVDNSIIPITCICMATYLFVNSLRRWHVVLNG